MLHWNCLVVLFCICIVWIASVHGRSSRGSGGKVSAASALNKVDGAENVQTSKLSPALPSNLTVGILTWNLAEKILRADDCKFLRDFKDCDIVALGMLTMCQV